MNQKTAIAILIALVVVVAGWLAYAKFGPQPIDPIVQQQFDWTFTDRGVNAETGAPRTNVAVRIAGVDVSINTYDGSCAEIDGTNWQLLPGELSGAICYFAGGGKEIGVFNEGGNLVLKEGDVEEGDAENPGTRSNFVPIKR